MVKFKIDTPAFKKRKESVAWLADNYEWENIGETFSTGIVIYKKKNAQIVVYLTTLSIQISFEGEGKQHAVRKQTLEKLELLFIHPRKNL